MLIPPLDDGSGAAIFQERAFSRHAKTTCSRCSGVPGSSRRGNDSPRRPSDGKVNLLQAADRAVFMQKQACRADLRQGMVG